MISPTSSPLLESAPAQGELPDDGVRTPVLPRKDPLVRARRHSVRICVFCTLAVAAAALWVFLLSHPGRADEIEAPAATQDARASLASVAVSPLPIAPFHTPVWKEARKPSESAVAVSTPTPPPPEPPPVRLELIAIEHDTRGTLRAFLFDPTVDRLVIAAVGDRVAGLHVSAVDENEVRLDRPGRQPITLKLRQDEAQSALRASGAAP